MDFVIDGSTDNRAATTIAISSFDEPSPLPRTRKPSREREAAIMRSTFYRTKGKRAFDLTVGSLMLLAAVPVLLWLLLLVALDGGKPIFAHSRVGKDGRIFRCLKIRSMRPDAEAQLKAILAADPAAAAEWAEGAKLGKDPRVTRIGAFLRKSSLDELPQLWNVLRGEMSLVGPRPVTQDELEERYAAAMAVYKTLKPGLTGPWQVSGRNDVSYDDRIALDVAYAAHHDFLQDFGIVLRTGLSVLKLTGR